MSQSFTRGAAGRAVANSRFSTPEARRDHMRVLGQRSAASRLTLSGAERERLIAAYRYLGQIMRRHGLDQIDGDSEDEASDG